MLASNVRAMIGAALLSMKFVCVVLTLDLYFYPTTSAHTESVLIFLQRQPATRSFSSRRLLTTTVLSNIRAHKFRIPP